MANAHVKDVHGGGGEDERAGRCAGLGGCAPLRGSGAIPGGALVLVGVAAFEVYFAIPEDHGEDLGAFFDHEGFHGVILRKGHGLLREIEAFDPDAANAKLQEHVGKGHAV